MIPEAIGILSVGIATGALFVTGLHALRDVLLGRLRNADQGGAGRGPREDRHEAPPAPGNTYDPRQHDDKARYRITYLCIALLAVMVLAPLAMVAFDVITVAEVKEFDVIIATLVPLVSVTIAYYFKSNHRGKE